ncbi:MAG TPA: hypothetical protein EYG06_11980 [Myxococcales bacterium]|nr:hypothetical protein [Myxococcales bacterium]
MFLIYMGWCGRLVFSGTIWTAFGAGLFPALPSQCLAGQGSPEIARILLPDRNFDVIPPPPWGEGLAEPLAFAGRALADGSIQFAGVPIDGPRLIALAGGRGPEPIEVRVRENFGRPVDLEDFILFLDDVLRDGARSQPVWITPGRGRRAGILLHPDDIFEGKPRLYGAHGPIDIDPPQPQVNLPPARDGDPPGSAWAMRYRNPSGESESLAALAAVRAESSFAARIRSLMSQLRNQGAEVYLNSTVRSRERGYLMWGAFVLSRASDEDEVRARAKDLHRAREEWGLSVSIEWLHPEGWQATREAARAMAETYEVVYATQAGARASDHYTGRAVDLVALALPRRLDLRAPNGKSRRFDLSPPQAARDLSLSPGIIEWIEVNFALKKLRSDYPHWSDAQ